MEGDHVFSIVLVIFRGCVLNFLRSALCRLEMPHHKGVPDVDEHRDVRAERETKGVPARPVEISGAEGYTEALR